MPPIWKGTTMAFMEQRFCVGQTGVIWTDTAQRPSLSRFQKISGVATYGEAPQLPAGYPAMIILSLVPPVFFGPWTRAKKIQQLHSKHHYDHYRIAGGTGSGKTTFVNKLVKITWIVGSGDLAGCHYKDSSHIPEADRKKLNYDHPDAIEWPLLRTAYHCTGKRRFHQPAGLQHAQLHLITRNH